ncbi:MAG: DUF2059 domain-containing protein [Burkholderiales bacterium]|nr:DUF2059 domain-containing protein [Burkholderiales bacterium]
MRSLFAALLITWSIVACAQDNLTLARELIDLKSGYVQKKRLLEDARLQAYVPILLKAVGRGQDWKPSHPNWKAVESRITGDWMQLNADYLRSLGRDPAYGWFDTALARDYAQAFTAAELRQLAGFYRSAAGRTLLDLEQKLLEFYPASMVRAFALAMVGTETLSGRESELFNSPASRIRRDFVRLFETEAIIREESFRAGGAYAEASYPTVQQGAIAIAADRIDALRELLPPAQRTSIEEFLASAPGRKERAFLARTTPVTLPAPEDPVMAMEKEAAFYARLGELTAQWRALAAR